MSTLLKVFFSLAKQDSFAAENEEQESEDERLHEDSKQQKGQEGNERLEEMPAEKKKGRKWLMLAFGSLAFLILDITCQW